jgi:hypothetical protein
MFGKCMMIIALMLGILHCAAQFAANFGVLVGVICSLSIGICAGRRYVASAVEMA